VDQASLYGLRLGTAPAAAWKRSARCFYAVGSGSGRDEPGDLRYLRCAQEDRAASRESSLGGMLLVESTDQPYL
jgi:hypothetical protein